MNQVDRSEPGVASKVSQLMLDMMKRFPQIGPSPMNSNRLVLRRLAAVLKTEKPNRRSNMIDFLTQEQFGSGLPRIYNRFFAPHIRDELTKMGLDPDAVDQLFPVPKMDIVKQAMTGSRSREP